MRKLIALVVAAGLLGALGAQPALAKKKKKPIHQEFSAQALPFPNLSSATGTEQRGCLAGEEGVHKVSIPFEAPSAGMLSAEIAGFTGDWDLFITDEAGKELVGSLEDQTAGAAAEEKVSLPVKAKQKVNVVPCNWLGEPSVDGHFMFVPK